MSQAGAVVQLQDFKGKSTMILLHLRYKGSRMELVLTLNHKGLQERLILILRQ